LLVDTRASVAQQEHYESIPFGDACSVTCRRRRCRGLRRPGVDRPGSASGFRLGHGGWRHFSVELRRRRPESPLCSGFAVNGKPCRR